MLVQERRSQCPQPRLFGLLMQPQHAQGCTSITSRGELAHTDRLTLERFDLLLGDAKASAGQASGSGRWRGDTLALDLLLDDLQPARLHGAAAALSISGPLSLQLRGLLPPGTAAAGVQRAADPQVELKATLSGRALDGSGLPVKLHVEGGGTARHLTVRQAEASAGDAQASFNLDAQAQPGGWQLRGAAHLTRFDPLPWWRGDLGTAWRRGPHRINADLKADLLWRGMPAQGLLLDQLLLAADGNATLHLADSVVAGVPVEGDWTLRNEGRSEGRQVSLVTRTAESPRPMPMIVRLPYISLRVANVDAVTVQSRVAGLVTMGPTITRLVWARIAL